MASTIAFTDQNLGIFEKFRPKIGDELNRVPFDSRTFVAGYYLLNSPQFPETGTAKTVYFCVASDLASGKFSIHVALMSRSKNCSLFAREKKIYQLLNGVPGVMKPRDFGQLGSRDVIFADLFNEGDLFAFLTSQPNLDRFELDRIGYLIARTVLACQAAGVINRDLKIDNIGIHKNSDGSYSALLFDFGHSFLIEEDDLHEAYRQPGTPMYYSKEYWDSLGNPIPADSKRDFYPLGSILFALFNKYLPSDTKEICGYYQFYQNRRKQGWEGTYGDVLVDLLDKNRAEQPPLSDIVLRMEATFRRTYPEKFESLRLEPLAGSAIPQIPRPKCIVEFENFIEAAPMDVLGLISAYA